MIGDQSAVVSIRFRLLGTQRENWNGGMVSGFRYAVSSDESPRDEGFPLDTRLSTLASVALISRKAQRRRREREKKESSLRA